MYFDREWIKGFLSFLFIAIASLSAYLDNSEELIWCKKRKDGAEETNFCQNDSLVAILIQNKKKARNWFDDANRIPLNNWTLFCF